MNNDLEHLRLLSIFHVVVAGIAALFSLFPVIHLAIGVAAVTGHLDQGHAPSSAIPQLVGWAFIAFATIWIGCFLVFAVCLLVSSRFLARRTHYLYCLVTACFCCMLMPFGTVLGVFTILVLQRASVKQLFQPPRR
jgi:hypothetical protein